VSLAGYGPANPSKVNGPENVFSLHDPFVEKVQHLSKSDKGG